MQSKVKAESYSFFQRLPSDSKDIDTIFGVCDWSKLPGGPLPYRVQQSTREGYTEIWVDSTRVEDARKFVY
jgi:hypothetical protein